MTTAYWCVLALVFFPPVLGAMAKSAGFDPTLLGVGVGGGSLGNDGDGSPMGFFFFPFESAPESTRPPFGLVTIRSLVFGPVAVVPAEPARPVARVVFFGLPPALVLCPKTCGLAMSSNASRLLANASCLVFIVI